jgi:hypothetical protein
MYNKNPDLIPFSTLILGTKVPRSLFFFQNKESRLKVDLETIEWGVVDWIHLAEGWCL